MPSSLLKTDPETYSCKNVLAGIICFAVSTGILFSVFAVRYHYFLKSLPDYYSWAKSSTVSDSEFPKLTPREVANLGFAHTTTEYPETSYIKIPAEKKPGVIRIGTFGDSHTQGSEAAQGHDYPSFLQQHFKNAGFGHVEVINFGVQGYGIHQSALMWRYLGKKYGLDYVIFMLLERYAPRDVTFIKKDEGCAGVHARYILKGNQLELVPVVGENRKEASLNYFRMIPPLRYIRYDQKAPSFMRALLPAGREWKFNPFYYQPASWPVSEEISKSYALLFEQIAKEVKSVVVFAHDDLMGDLAKRIQSPNVYVLRSQMTSFLDGGLYLAPRSHRSALGNDLQARELFALLTGRERPEGPVIEIRESSQVRTKHTNLAAQSLEHYTDLSVHLGGYLAGTFTEMIRGSIRIKKEIDLATSKISGLLFLSLSQLSFLPLDFLVKQDEPVFISFQAAGKPVQIPIGKIETTGGVISRFVLASPEGRKDFIVQVQDGFVKVDREITQASIQMPGRVREVKILIGNKEVILGKKEKKDKETRKKTDVDLFRLKPKKKLLYLRASADQYAPIESIEPKKGKLELILTSKDGGVERLPIFLEYEVTVPPVHSFSPAYQGVIQKE